MTSDRVSIYELDADSLTVRMEHFPMVAGFEIYDLVVLDEASAICPAADRLIAPDIHAMARSYYEAAKSLHAEISERGRAEARERV